MLVKKNNADPKTKLKTRNMPHQTAQFYDWVKIERRSGDDIKNESRLSVSVSVVVWVCLTKQDKMFNQDFQGEGKTEEIKHDKGKMRKGNIRNQYPTNENIVKELSTEHTHTHGIDCKPINKRKKKQFMLAKKKVECLNAMILVTGEILATKQTKVSLNTTAGHQSHRAGRLACWHDNRQERQSRCW